MIAYIIRRLLYAVPILIGVNLLTFALFFFVNSPDDMARVHLGGKRVTPEAIAKWKEDRGYNKPLLFNAAGTGTGKLTDTIFFTTYTESNLTSKIGCISHIASDKTAYLIIIMCMFRMFPLRQ